jgi:hypothetical protein
MNTDIDDSDCIVIQKGGGEVGKLGVKVAGSQDHTDAGAGALSPEVVVDAEVEGGGGGPWERVTRRKTKAASTPRTGLQLVKTMLRDASYAG